MTCDDKTIAPWQVLIKGSLIQQKEKFSKNGYRTYVMRILGGPSNYQQYFEVEIKTADEDKYKDVSDGSEVAALCWVNGRLWNDMVFTNLSLIHLEVVRADPVEEAEESDTDWIDDFSDDDDLPF